MSLREVSLPIDGPYNLDRTMAVLTMGRGNPCLRHTAAQAQLTLATPDGPVAISAVHEAERLRVVIDGGGAGWVEPYLPGVFGLTDDASGYAPEGRLKRIGQPLAGLRLPKLPTVYPRLVQVVLQQLIAFRDACRGWRLLVRKFGVEVPGSEGLYHAPTAAEIARLSVADLMACEILPRHARTILSLAKIADGLERAWAGGREPEAIDRLAELLIAQPGVGDWTVGYLRGAGLGDADAVVLGDYGHPHQVAYFFTGEERGDDDQMLRLLQPYRPHRFRVLMHLILGAPTPPRRGPRRARLGERFR